MSNGRLWDITKVSTEKVMSGRKAACHLQLRGQRVPGRGPAHMEALRQAQPWLQEKERGLCGYSRGGGADTGRR